MPSSGPMAATVKRLEAASGSLALAAQQRMEASLPWYSGLTASDRSWITLVAQAGITAFVDWARRPATARTITAEVFGTAPRELTRAVSLQQTVDLVRVTIDVVEEQADTLAAPGEERLLRDAVLRYSREVAFAAAQVYAQAAEARGAWDARLESLVADALLRDEVDDAVRSRAAALGWGAPEQIVVVVGPTPDGEPEAVVDRLRRNARHLGLDVITSVHGHELVAILGGPGDPLVVAEGLLPQFGPGPVVVGPTVTDLTKVPRSAAAALAGRRACAAWPDAPSPVAADDLLPERALDGDAAARAQLVHEVYVPLAAASGGLLETAAAVLEKAGSLEGAARALFVHPNTVRYRLGRIADVCGYTPTQPRDAFVLRLALALGRLDDQDHQDRPNL
ncbi:MAG: helix-turn-helix domain-containing protein [Actinomycetes bacterium]